MFCVFSMVLAFGIPWSFSSKTFFSRSQERILVLIYTSLEAFRLSANMDKVANPCFEEQSETCTFTEDLTLPWISLLVVVYQILLMSVLSKKKYVEKNNIPISVDIFFCPSNCIFQSVFRQCRFIFVHRQFRNTSK